MEPPSNVAIVLFFLAAAAAQNFPPYTEDCRHNLYPPKEIDSRPIAVPTFQVNLDLPGEKRWTELATAKSQEMGELIGVILNIVRRFTGGILIDIVNSELPKLIGGLPGKTKLALLVGLVWSKKTFWTKNGN